MRTRSYWERWLATAVETDWGAWLVAGCIPTATIFSFNVPILADFALGILALGGMLALSRGERSLPIIMALVWIAFVLASAVYAVALDLSGRHFGSIGKHIPLALGPLAALSLYSAMRWFDLMASDLLIMLLGGVVAGAVLVLVRNGALGAVFGAVSPVSEGLLGAVNRNYAGLACGVLVVSGTGLAFHLLSRIRAQPLAAGVAIVALMLAIAGSIVLLRLLQSRTALLATIIAMVVWLAVVFGSSMKQRPSRIRMLGFGSLVVLVALSVVLFQWVSERPLLKGKLSEFVAVAPAIVEGRLGENVGILATAEARLQLVAVAIDLIRERPWLGWGPDVSSLIAVASPFPELKDLNQFHNGYVQEVVSFGFIGSLLSLALLSAIIRSAISKYRRCSQMDTLSPVLFATVLALAIYVAVTNVTETILFVKPCAVLCTFLAALACLPSHTKTE